MLSHKKFNTIKDVVTSVVTDEEGAQRIIDTIKHTLNYDENKTFYDPEKYQKVKTKAKEQGKSLSGEAQRRYYYNHKAECNAKRAERYRNVKSVQQTDETSPSTGL